MIVSLLLISCGEVKKDKDRKETQAEEKGIIISQKEEEKEVPEVMQEPLRLHSRQEPQKQPLETVSVVQSDSQQNPYSPQELKERERLSPLERAKGKEITDQWGPIITWGSTKELPTLDEVFPVVDKLPEGVEFPKAWVEPISLPETEERKRLKEKIVDEDVDHLDAIKTRDGKCIIEFYGAGPLGSKDKRREDWLRSIDPETKEVIWKYEDPALSDLAVLADFARDTDYFILTNLPYHESKGGVKLGVKLFSCKKGYLRDIYYEEGYTLSPQGRITPDGKNILISTKKGKVLNFDINGKLIWEKEVNPYHGPLLPLYISNDGLYFSTLYRAPEMHSLEDKRMGVPRELQLIVVNLGETILKRRFYANLGDNSMDTNVIEILGIIKKDIVGVWVMDGSGFFIKQIYMVIQWFSLQKMMYMLSESIP